MFNRHVAAVILGTACMANPALAQPLPEAHGPSSIGYPNVEAALSALRARPDAKESEQHGWTLFVVDAEQTFWAFPPKGDPAYPAAVKRWLTQDSTGIFVSMSVLCQSTKEACDKLVRNYNQLNDDLRKSMTHAQ